RYRCAAASLLFTRSTRTMEALPLRCCLAVVHTQHTDDEGTAAALLPRCYSRAVRVACCCSTRACAAALRALAPLLRAADATAS
ncbi:hypothetical protein Dimus_018390, partial [Dionaea muscipula]